MSLQVITNILNDYLSLEQEGKELLLRLLIETEDEDVSCPCCDCELEELLEEASAGNLRVAARDPEGFECSTVSSTNMNDIWKEYVSSGGSVKIPGVPRF